jgi:hypothetical protein
MQGIGFPLGLQAHPPLRTNALQSRHPTRLASSRSAEMTHNMA